ncbi:FecR family protein [Pedobacter nyackensis]|uniref:FecR family protein n=1 Tax=Pedobacter nyackensis TaxID=475255 RepID=UPI0029309D86|nr:FecR family protein [Pedobacter nyackensis]
MNKTDLNKLVEKYRAGNCTEEEKTQLMNWFHEVGADEQLGLTDEELEEAQQNIYSAIQAQTKHTTIYWPRIAAAAVILIVFGLGLSFYKNRDNKQNLAGKEIANDIKPGSNKATLTLADGRKIVLDDAKNGLLVETKGVKISKTADGELGYMSTNATAANVEINTIETPLGGQYQINLPDGTKVWLNSASVLKYPVKFTGKERKVELSGEGYFEVAKNKSKPFRVITQNNEGIEQQTEVLGTHFNINAYSDDMNIKTTLLEGSVKVNRLQAGTKKQESEILRQGQQSVLNTRSMTVNSVDTEAIVAWKNGQFMFNNEELKNAMKSLSRWYNVDINYDGNFEDISIGGTVSRKNTLAQTLRLLELTGNFKFKIQGRRVTVMN